MYEDIIKLIGSGRTGVSQVVIDEAEKRLGLTLPPSFKWWLHHYGGGQIGGDILYGLDENDEGKPDLVKLARKNEKKGRAGLKNLVFMIGNEEQFYFDTSQPDRDGEYRVYLWDAIQAEPFLYAPSFADFLRKRIQETGNA